MINAKILPLGLNLDDEPRTLQSTDALNMENVRIGISQNGKNYSIRNIPSTILLYDNPSWITPNTVGSCADISKQRLYSAYYDVNGEHGILCYDLAANTTYTVLLSSQVQGGLNFSRQYRPDRNIRMAGDLLFITDDYNEPRCINAERGIKLNHPDYVTNADAYVSPLAYTDITIIKKPPIYRLNVQKKTDTAFLSNYIVNNAYQFFTRYWYKDYQYSVVSIYSQLIPANSVGDTFNYIALKLAFGEIIPDTVQRIEYGVRYGNTGSSFIVHYFDKNNPADLAAIQAHNAGTTQLEFDFYDNKLPSALDSITANTAFDDVALLAKSLELARNRMLIANVLKGYDAPSQTSLALTAGSYDTGSAGSYTAAWKYFYLTYQSNTNPSDTGTRQIFYAYVSTLTTTSYYYAAYQSATPPGTLNAADADTSWATETQLAAYIQRNTAPPSGYHWMGAAYTFTNTGATTALIFPANLNSLQFFKSSSSYSVSIVFYDRYRRKCGYVKPVSVDIPDRTYSQTVFASVINWTLSNTNAINEIPDWAFYYTINISLNSATRFFEQIFVQNTTYATKDVITGQITYTATTYDKNTTYAIALDLTPLFGKGLGYTYDAQSEDIVRIYFTDNTNKSFSVIGQDGSYILLKPEDIGTLGTGVFFFIEIYTPYKPSETEPLYETGDMMDILNPETSNRQYSVLSGGINGDAYAFERDKGTMGTELYFVEAMSPNDKVWQVWNVDRGWPNFLDTIGQQRKETNIDWSDTYINGTKNNGLNKFNPLNTKDIGNSSGAIQKIQLANKQSEDGSVLIVITDETSLSAYLGEINLYRSAQQDGLITSDDIIGTINEHQNGKGTFNPETVVETEGAMFWFSTPTGEWVQYAQDGVIPISAFKAKGFFDRYAKKYLSNGFNSYDNPIHSVYDKSSDELLCSLPAVEDEGFTADLPSYTEKPDYASGIANPFFFYDGTAKTVIYKVQVNKWAGAYKWMPDCMEVLNNKLFGFKDGILYLHNENLSSFNVIYGIPYPQRICVVVNVGDPSVVKDVMDIALEVNGKIPTYTVLYSSYPIEQITDLASDDTDANGEPIWEIKDGVVYGSFLRDRLSGSDDMGENLFEGDIITSATPFVMVEFQEYNSPLIINFINIGVLLSSGHNSLLIK